MKFVVKEKKKGSVFIMPTCKDCIHVEVCVDYAKVNMSEKIAKEVIPQVLNAGVICNFFKDRSKFVELPCKEGQKVYRICPVPKGKGCRSCPWEYCDCHDIGYQKDRQNIVREVKARDFEWIIKRNPYFGRIYFSTCEEAEQALKECEVNANL